MSSTTTILHVEDDELLATAVRSAFEAFGFRGRFLSASKLHEAESLLADPDRRIDLVISDMELADGTGLDVVQAVRSTASHGHVPILILSGDSDPTTVDRAYALGANSYVATSVRGRRTSDIVRTIYDHWLQDTRLPDATQHDRTHDVLAMTMSIRSRIAQQYMAIAERLGGERGAFWMGIAQREGNLANLLMFLAHQLQGRALPDDLSEDLAVHQKEVLRVLDELSANPPDTEDGAFRYLLALGGPVDTPVFARAVGLLFPASPLAVAALLDALANNREVVATAIDAHTRDPALHDAAAHLRASVVLLRALGERERATADRTAPRRD